MKVDKGVNEIKAMIQSPQPSGSKAPMVSAIGNDRLFAVSLTLELIKNAEVRRGWSAIGVDDWIQAGRWWLMKVWFVTYREIQHR